MPTADELIGPAAVATLHAGLAAATGRPMPALATAARELAPLGFRQRSDHLRAALLSDLPASYPAFAAMIRAALADPAFTGWLIAPVAAAVTARALADGDPAVFDDGLTLLAELTPRLTAEWAIRPFLATDLARTLAVAQSWTTHPDEHVRRLASEGTRPRLPWGTQVPALWADPPPARPILDALYTDQADYVRRSVANHLNDFSLRQPELVTTVTANWLAAPDANTGPLVRHALRTLTKQGHPAALIQLGAGGANDLAVTGPDLPEARVTVGGVLPFTATVTNQQPAGPPRRVVIDYVIWYRKANGSLAPKVYKLTTATLAPGESLRLDRKRSFAVITTRVFHPGEHEIALQVNGEQVGRRPFTLLPAP